MLLRFTRDYCIIKLYAETEENIDTYKTTRKSTVVFHVQDGLVEMG